MIFKKRNALFEILEQFSKSNAIFNCHSLAHERPQNNLDTACASKTIVFLGLKMTLIHEDNIFMFSLQPMSKTTHLKQRL